MGDTSNQEQTSHSLPFGLTPRAAPLLVVVCVLFWPLSDSLVKYLYQNTADGTMGAVLSIIMYAMFVRGFFLFFLVDFRFKTKNKSKYPIGALHRHPDFTAGMIKGFLTFTTTVFILMAIQSLSLLQAMAIFHTAPFIATLFAPLITKEKFNVGSVFCLALGMMGILVIVNPSVVVDDGFNFGYVYAILAAVSSSIYMLVWRRYHGGDRWVGFRTTGLMYMLCAVFVEIMIMSSGDYGVSMSSPANYFGGLSPYYMMVFALVIITAVLGETIGELGFNHTTIIMGGLLGYAELVWAIVLDYLIFDIVMTGSTMVGTFLIVLAGLYSIYLSQKPIKIPDKKQRSKKARPQKAKK